MRTDSTTLSTPLLFCAAACAALAVSAVPAAAQDPYANPPIPSPATGLISPGGSALGGIETVNAVNGNVTLNFPLAQLPPDNVSLGAGVSLVYNSAIYDAPAVPQSSTQADLEYIASSHGGGWNYGYKYKLWAQARIPWNWVVNSNACTYLSSAEKEYWYKNFIQTPDGSNHILYRVYAIPSTNGPADDPTGTGFLSTDFGGFGNANSNCFSQPYYQPQYTGQLVFVTVDGSYIRVVANTAPGGNGTWVAYLPNGTQISGYIATTWNPTGPYYAIDSPATQITDRNNNIEYISSTCPPGEACTETVSDVPGREIQVNYVSSGETNGSWTDTVVSYGPNNNGATVTNQTIVSSSVYFGPSFGYPCGMTTSGFDGAYCPFNNGLWQVNSIQMPAAAAGGNQTTYAFGYTSSAANNWGEVHTVEKCAGVNLTTCPQPQWTVSYGYTFDNGSVSARPPGVTINPIATRTLSYNEVLDTVGTTPLTETTNYSIWYPTNSIYALPGGQTVGPNAITAPNGAVTTLYLVNLCESGTLARDTCAPVLYGASNPDGSFTQTQWTSNQSPPAGIPTGTIFNPYPAATAETRASLSRGNQITLDVNGNMTGLTRYNWGSTVSPSGNPANGPMTGISGSSIQTAGASYNYESSGLTYWGTSSGQPQSFLRSLASVSLNGTTLTEYSYDNLYTTANVTAVKQWDSAQNAFISQGQSYLSNGNVTTQTDANGNSTATCYDGNSLYPAAIVVAASSTGCPAPGESAVGRKGTFYSEFFTGVLLNASDNDNNIATTYTYDNLSRQTGATQTGSGLQRTSCTTYDDVGLTVTTTKPGSSCSGAPQGVTSYDPLGRVRLVTDPDGNRVAKAYRYDTNGNKVSYILESNPYASGSSPSGWTVTTLDSVGRTVNVNHYSAGTPPAPPAPWGTSTAVTGTAQVSYDQTLSACNGPVTKVTDEALNSHWNCPDGLDRLVAVTEPDANSGAAGQVTQYGYDSQNNLTTVDAGGVTITCKDGTQHLRCFNYSTLSRLMWASNPESGTTINTYDNNGNLLTQTDANGTLTALAGYDAVNRPASVTYTPGSTGVSGYAVSATPTVTYSYDTCANGSFRGALCSVSTTASITSYSYDGFGRIAGSTQQTGGGTYNFTYGYSLTDQLTSMIYPSGRQIGYALDGADRVTSVQNVTGGGYYASGIGYTADGSLTGMTMGQGLTQSLTWNDRMQPLSMTAKSSGGAQLLALNFYPCANPQAPSCASGNNGNLQSQTIAMPGLSLSQSYSYDHLNRLTGANESGNGQTGWAQSYGYDTFGNRWVPTNQNLPILTLETPTAQSSYSTTNPFQMATWSYDHVGNVLQTGNVLVRQFSYDAENRQVSATVPSGNTTATATYVYDGNGLRVQKVWSGATTTYVYDAWGNLAAEYSNAAEASACGQPTCYVAQDHLGSTRMITDGAGSTTSPSVIARYDYEPFGQEIGASYDGRTTALGYAVSPDSVTEKFTGQARDPETGIDWYRARYMSGAQGRFQSADPGNAGADATDPRTWNGFAYVNNNPLSLTDPSGMELCGTCVGLETGNPVGIAIGVAIDVGEILFGVFGFGGGPPPTIAPALATPSSPVLASPDDDSGDPSANPFGLPGLGGNSLMNCKNTLKGCPPTAPSRKITYPSAAAMAARDAIGLHAHSMSSKAPNPYGPDLNFTLTSAQCMFEIGGDSEWGQSVRGCLAAMYKATPPGVPYDAVKEHDHGFCYREAARKTGPVGALKGFAGAVVGAYACDSGYKPNKAAGNPPQPVPTISRGGLGPGPW